jgi:hypothetical protein
MEFGHEIPDVVAGPVEKHPLVADVFTVVVSLRMEREPDRDGLIWLWRKEPNSMVPCLILDEKIIGIGQFLYLLLKHPGFNGWFYVHSVLADYWSCMFSSPPGVQRPTVLDWQNKVFEKIVSTAVTECNSAFPPPPPEPPPITRQCAICRREADAGKPCWWCGSAP